MIKIQFETNNAAFSQDLGDFEFECKRILDEAKQKLEQVGKNEENKFSLKDLNGNKIGFIEIDRNEY